MNVCRDVRCGELAEALSSWTPRRKRCWWSWRMGCSPRDAISSRRHLDPPRPSLSWSTVVNPVGVLQCVSSRDPAPTRVSSSNHPCSWAKADTDRFVRSFKILTSSRTRQQNNPMSSPASLLPKPWPATRASATSNTHESPTVRHAPLFSMNSLWLVERNMCMSACGPWVGSKHVRLAPHRSRQMLSVFDVSCRPFPNCWEMLLVGHVSLEESSGSSCVSKYPESHGGSPGPDSVHLCLPRRGWLPVH